MKNTNILAQEERGQLKLDRSNGASKQLKKQLTQKGDRRKKNKATLRDNSRTKNETKTGHKRII